MGPQQERLTVSWQLQMAFSDLNPIDLREDPSVPFASVLTETNKIFVTVLRRLTKLRSLRCVTLDERTLLFA